MPPEIEDDALADRAASDSSLEKHLRMCYPAAFPLDWSDDHQRLIAKIDEAATDGGLFALAMPRGSGKTTILIRAAIWAILTGRRRYLCLIGATEPAATSLLKSIKMELRFNPILDRLYPKELWCIKRLEGEARRALGQIANGRDTTVEWGGNRIGLGVIPGSAASGAYISICGITGNIRGQFVTLKSGEIVRPDMTLCDDPQTRESAKSETQCDDRHAIMMGDVLGMSGPTTRLAGLCTCTVIYRNDFADRLLDRSLSPDWQGDRCKMVYKWPENEQLWDEYRHVYEQELLSDDKAKSIKFVNDNYEELHRGAVVGWKQRHNKNEVSALHHAYNLRFRDEPSFFAEYQNEPMSGVEDMPFDLQADQIVKRIASVERNEVPLECEKLVAFADVQKNMLYYAVTAWTMEGRGYVIDYGTYPDQGRLHYSKRDPAKTLSKVSGADGLNESLWFGLEALSAQLLDRVYLRKDNVTMQLSRLGIDIGWGYSTKIIRRFCRESEFLGRLTPMKGQYYGATGQQFDMQALQKWMQSKLHYRIQPPPKNERGVREVLVDTNWWKSLVAERLCASPGADHTLLLFNGRPHEHRLFAEHCCAEEPQIVENKVGNRAIEWKVKRNGLDNDFFDCLVGNAVLASTEGVNMIPQLKAPVKRPKPNPRQDDNHGHSFFVTAR